ncbi:hypothetical protein G6F61_004793 [Rhizopus arrhizus]|nr:hypothetical protein G6F61_004793 [Rhizopus arrhizus]
MNNLPNNPHPERKIAVPRRRLNRTASTTSLSSVGSTNSIGNASAGGFVFPSAVPQQPTFGSGFGSNLPNNNPTQNTGAFGTVSEGFSGGFNTPAFGQQASQQGSQPFSTASSFGSNNSNNEAGNQTAPFGFNAPKPATNTAFNFFSNTSSANPGASSFTGFAFGAPAAPVTAAKPPIFGGLDSSATTQPNSTPAFSFGTNTNNESAPTSQAPTFTFGQQQNTTSPFTGFQSSQPAESDSFGTRKRRYSVEMEDVTQAEEEQQSNKKSFVFGSSGGSGSVGSAAPTFSFGSLTAKADESKQDMEGQFSIPASNSTTTTEAKTSAFTFPSTTNIEKKDEDSKSLGNQAATSVSPFSFSSITTSSSTEKKNDSLTTSKPFTFQAPTSSTISFGSTENKDANKPFSFTPPVTSDNQSKISSFSFGTIKDDKKDREKTDEATKNTKSAEKGNDVSQANDIPQETEVSGNNKIIKDDKADKEKSNKEASADSDATKVADKPPMFSAPISVKSPGSSLSGEKKSSDDSFAAPLSEKKPAASVFSFEATASSPKITVEDSSSKDDVPAETAFPEVSEPEETPVAANTPKDAGSVQIVEIEQSGDDDTSKESTVPDKTETTKPFSFGQSFSTQSKPASKPLTSSPFTFGSTATSEKKDDTATSKPSTSQAASGFTFGNTSSAPSTKPALSFGSISSAPSSAPAISFESTSSAPSTTAASSTPAFTFGSTSSTSKPVSTFTFGMSSSTSTTTPAFTFGSASSAPTSTPTISFGSTTSAPSSTPSFTFGSTSAASSTAPAISFESTSSAPKSTPAFTFGKAPSAPSSTPAIGFGSTSTTASSAPATSLGSTSNAPSTTTFSFGSTSTAEKEAEKSESSTIKKSGGVFNFSTLPDSKPATSESTTISADTLETSKPTVSVTSSSAPTTSASTSIFSINKESAPSTTTAAAATVTTAAATSTTASTVTTTPVFSIKPITETTKSTEPEKPGSVSIAFSKIDESERDKSSVLSLKHTAKYISRDTSYTPTTLKSDVAEPNQVTYTTRFWELPNLARGELAELQHFINQQADKRDNIEKQMHSTFASTLRDIQTKTENLSIDADILSKQLEIQGNTLYELIDKNARHRTNIAAASSVLNQENRNWRTLGASENWQFFVNTVNNLEQKTQNYSQAIQSIEEAIGSLDKESGFSPELLSEIMTGQKRMYLSLAGRVAELHEEVERIVKKRKFKANDPPGVADSRHNSNNKPFEFKTWAQTVKNQKRSASFHNKPDNNNVANLESQTVFLQAIDKHSIVIAASEFEGLNFKDKSLNLVLRDQFPKGIGLRERKIGRTHQYIELNFDNEEDKMDTLKKEFLILDRKIKVQTTMDKNSEVVRIGITNIPYEKDDKLKPLMIQLFEKYGSILEIGFHHTVDGDWFNGKVCVTLVKDKTKIYEPLTL